MPEGEVTMGVGDVKALAERAGSSQRAKMLELEALLARSDQLEKEVEGGSYYGSRTIDQIAAGWDAFYRVEDRIEQNELIIREYSHLFLEISSFSSRKEQMREISQPTQIQERGAGVARCESQLVKPLLETGSESTAQQQTKPQPQPQQQQQQQQQFEAAPLFDTGSESTAQQQQRFEAEEIGMVLVVNAGKKIVEFETGEKARLEDLVVKLNYDP